MGGDRTISKSLGGPPRPAPLYKQKSWSPDTLRDEAWLRRKGNSTVLQQQQHRRRNKSVTDEDLDDLKACIELGFGFDSPEIDPKLSDTFPALEFYYAVNKQYSQTMSRSSSASSMSSDFDVGSSENIFDSGEDPKMVKTRLRQWAQVVACSVRQSSSSSSSSC